MKPANDKGVGVDELRFDERVAIVTGAGRGLGRAHALLLGARGAQVVVNDDGGSVNGEGTSGEPAESVAEEIRAAGGIAIADSTSVATPEGGQAIVARAIDEFGRLDIVVANAGILRDKAFHNMTPEMFDHVMDVHLRGAFFVTQPAFVHMRERGYGRVVTTSSSAGLYGNFGQVNYSTAKMGLVGMARTIATEGARFNIKANAVAPNAFTRMTENLITGSAAERLKPDLVAPVVAWLCHEDCPVTGQVFQVGSGRVARVFVAETTGYWNAELTPEDVVANFDTIMDESGYSVPASVADAGALMAAPFKS
jgi:NAD(P)-dependent dehydrogenase (short-subunit alcohol dehydrogenase family)